MQHVRGRRQPGFIGTPAAPEPPARTAAGTPRRWLVLDVGTGTIVSIDMPAAFSLRAVRGDLVWGVERDAVEVEAIVAYRVLR